MTARMLKVMFISLVISFLVGCSAGPVAPQKPWYPINGSLVWVESADINLVYEAVIKGSTELNFTIVDKGRDGLTGKVKAKTFEGETVLIKLEAETAEWTRVTVNVRTISNKKQKENIIYEKIKQVISG